MTVELFCGPQESPEQYRLIEPIGSGGEGQVWLGVDSQDLANSRSGAAELAVKELMPKRQVAGGGANAPSPAERERWINIVERMKGRTLPHVVAVLDGFWGAQPHSMNAGPADPNTAYIVMRRVTGMDYREYLEAYPRDIEPLRQAAQGLDEMHSLSLLHRDVKPRNLVLTIDSNGTSCTLVDLSLVKQLGEPPSQIIISDGYSDGKPQKSEFSDFLGFAATLYTGITGERPPLHDPSLIRKRLEQAVGQAAARQMRAALDLDEERRRKTAGYTPMRMTEWFDDVCAKMGKPVPKRTDSRHHSGDGEDPTVPLKYRRLTAGVEQVYAFVLDNRNFAALIFVAIFLGLFVGLLAIGLLAS